MSRLLEAVALSKHFVLGKKGVFARQAPVLRAVDHVSLTIETGETLGLVGESGCGKSTLGRLLIRLLPATEGNILFDGVDITALSAKAMQPVRRAMQIVFQDPYGALNPRMTVEDIVAEPLLIHGARNDGETRAKVGAMLDRVGLSARIGNRFPHEFSGGQRQRIGIARALILRPKFIVCDEAVSALDVSVQAQIVNLLGDLQQEFGLTYLFIAHDLAVVKHISTRVAVMYLGKIVEVAEKSALYAAPRHPYTRALIAAVPATHPRERQAARARRAGVSGDIPSALHPPTGCRFHTRCPLAIARCKTEEPVLSGLLGGHQTACHLVPP
ncbi:MAG: ATP-binding cassette domain-containing protein [Rhodospirillales bacterium]|nr:ATP-binding cassette domain-containing protein [Rhodospirillales bacterium]